MNKRMSDKDILLGNVVNEVVKELVKAEEKHPSFRSEHEGIAIIEEEFLELRQAVFEKYHTKEYQNIEAIQLAAMAIRFICDLTESTWIGGKK